VCNYHRDFYRPENLCLIITGSVTPEEVIKTLQPIEEKIKKKVSTGAPNVCHVTTSIYIDE
jgi:predicted Zn-dependent peptidase